MIPLPQLVAVNTFQRSFRISLAIYVYTRKIILKAQATVNPRKDKFSEKN